MILCILFQSLNRRFPTYDATSITSPEARLASESLWSALKKKKKKVKT